MLLLSTMPVTVEASGFFVNQQSVRNLGRVNAGSAAASDDPSTVFFNPAGLTQLWQEEPRPVASTLISIGAQVLVPLSDLANRGSDVASPGTLGMFVPYAGGDFSDPADATPIPNIFAARAIDERIAIGFGITAPFGLAAEFRDNWFGRYDAIEASLRTINLGAVAAFRLTPSLSLGGGVDVQHARSTLVSAIPNPFVPGGPSAATDGRIETRGSDWSAGYNVGVLFHPKKGTRVGVHYRSAMKHKISGSADTSGLTGPLAFANGSTDATARLNLPAILALGVAHGATNRVTLLANVEWYDWSRFEEIRVRFADGRADGVRSAHYRDTWAIAIGGEYRISRALTLRSGVRLDRTPTVDGFRDTTFPDADRVWLGLGATYHVTRRWTTDVAFKHAFFEKADIGVTRTFFDGSPLATTVRVKGTADSSVTTFSLNMGYAF